MPFTHILLVLSVVLIWGINFIFVKIGVDELPPLFLCALRFLLASVPAVFFIKPPKIQFRTVVEYGLIMFALQFVLIFTALQIGMTAGMASLLMQVQVFFSMFFAVVFLGETLNNGQLFGAFIAFLGIVLVAFHFDHHISFVGFLFVLGAAAAWGYGNLITKKLQSTNMIPVIAWGSLSACLPVFILSLLIEGPSRIWFALQHVNSKGLFSLLYIVYVSTWIGYGIWNWLVRKYPVGTVVPYTLLIPVVGLLSSILFLGEPFEVWKLESAVLVIGGLVINVLASRLFLFKKAKPSTT